MKNSNSRTIHRIAVTGLWIAIVFLFTYLIKFPLPFGYAHAGDAMMMTATLFLPFPLSLIPGVAGAVLADLAGGFPAYMPFTAVIKALMLVLFVPFAKLKNKVIKYLLPSFCAELLGTGLYFLTDMYMFGIGGAVSSLPGNLVQFASNIILFVLIAYILESRFEIKK